LKIRQRDYPEQHVDGLAPAQVTPPESVRARIRADAAKVAAARATDTDRGEALDDFVWPAVGPITGVFGSRRVLNGTPRARHFGVDVAAGEGTEVVAVAGGIVRLADDLYFSGNTVVIDHGHGLSSSYLHLSQMSVAEGDEVAQGAPIGRIGATGRATGPHLDWRVNWFGARLDPALVAGAMPEPPATD
jgi:murein DD-endopeptidase MepM/ murein hydrolase activator NlpD